MSTKTAKHTPGPWRAGYCAKELASGPHGEWCIKGEKRPPAHFVAWTDSENGFRSAEIEANARLIAAAPELLEALEDMVRQVHAEDNALFGREAITTGINPTRAMGVIMKAKGETE